MGKAIEPKQEKILQAIEALLSEHIGLRENALGRTSFEKTIAKVMASEKIPDAADFLGHLHQSPSVLAALVEAIVVPETSFFRNPESFDYLREYILSIAKERLSAKKHSRTIRVLSIPCSTGEEPYSIAITLLEAGLSPDAFHVDALDISTHALEKAQQGIFTQYSFRRTTTYSPERHIQQYFQYRNKRYTLNQQVRSQVQFHHGNLIDPGCLQRFSPYDIIFCRNLLIYFHQEARATALHNIDRLLHPEGLLFVGYADTGPLAQTHFNLIGSPHAFVYKKSFQQPEKTAKNSTKSTFQAVLPKKINPAVKKGSGTLSDSNHDATASYKVSSNQQPEGPQRHSLQNALESIQDLADQGHLDSALDQCDRYLQQHPVHAAAHLLLGEIYLAKGNNDLANKALQKSLYLNPNCQKTLIHRIHLAKAQSNHEEIQRLTSRLERLTSRQNL